MINADCHSQRLYDELSHADDSIGEVLSHEGLLELDVAAWAEEDCHLYCWTTNNFMTRVCVSGDRSTFGRQRLPDGKMKSTPQRCAALPQNL